MGTAGAELVAKTLDNTAAYINGWRKHISEDTGLIIKASSAAQKAADHIIGANTNV
jgi:antirestriction protein ArdC